MNIGAAFTEIARLAVWLTPGCPRIHDIQARVCERYRLRPIDMVSARRAREVARPRQVAMYLCREMTPRSFPEIGRMFGNRDHTTVMYACRQIERLRAADKGLDAAICALAAELSTPSRAEQRA